MNKICIKSKEQVFQIKENEINNEKLFNIFQKSPNTVVYVTNNEMVSGIITLGDFKRNQLDGNTLVNRNFTKIQEGYENDAIDIINKKRNIKSIPIVDSENRIVAEYTSESEEKKDSIPYEFVKCVISEARIFIEKYPNFVFVADNCTKELILSNNEDCTVICADNITIDQIYELSIDKNVYICDFGFTNTNVREIYYEKYNIDYVIVDFFNLKEVENIMKDRTNLFNSIGVFSDGYLLHCLKDSITPVSELKNNFKWNTEYECYEYMDKWDGKIECIFTLVCFFKNPYILVNNKLIPVLAYKYFLGTVTEMKASDADISCNIIPAFINNGVKFIAIGSPILEGQDFELLSREGSVWDNPEVAAKFVSQGENCDMELVKELKSLLKTIVKDGFIQFADFTGKYANYIQNERYTVGNPKEFSNTIYLYGPCVVRGKLVRDEDTIGSVLRKKISQEFYIKNCGSSWLSMNYSMRNNKYKSGDVVIFIFSSGKNMFMNNGIKVHSIIEAYNRIPDLKNHVWDNIMHGDKVLTKYLADEIYNICISEEVLERGTDDKKELQFGQKAGKEIDAPEGLKKWISDVKCFKINCKRSGAIVMNCNPFTRGHRYLIDEALKQVDILYVFVVEEDKSFFKFRDRLEMVRLGVSDLDNVVVIPSGQYIISTETLPGYFKKEEQPYVKYDATYDLAMFAGVIAKEFDISTRFAGEEPEDPFTRQYNLQMQRILPQFGVSFCEIPRKQVGDKVISASTVRKCILNKDFEKIKELVLPQIFNYLEQNYFDKF